MNQIQLVAMDLNPTYAKFFLSDSVHKEAGEGICELRLADSFSFNTVILQVDHLRNGTKIRGLSESLALAYLGRALIVL